MGSGLTGVTVAGTAASGGPMVAGIAVATVVIVIATLHAAGLTEPFAAANVNAAFA
jgi:hypothetical protein